MAQSTCSIEGCGKPHLARGWCSMHYTRWRNHGTTEAPERTGKGACVGPECARPAETGGMCKSHDSQMRRKGALSPISRKPRPVVDGKRQCRLCDEWLPLDAFAHAHNTVAGVKTACRECCKVEMSAWKAANPTYFTEWHKANPDSRMLYLQWRRAALKGREAERVQRREVFERDEWKCGLCGGEIDPDLRWPDPGSVTLDHIVPLARGGGHTYGNTQAAHASCNMRKGDRLDSELVL